MLIALLIIFIITAAIRIFLNQPQFGKIYTGKKLKELQSSPNFRKGRFQNVHFTPDLKEGVGYFTVIWEFFFQKSKRSRPMVGLPAVKTDLHSLAAGKNILVWFGHSSYFMQIDGKKILVDPVFSRSASPVKFTTKSFTGTNVYSVEDMPFIDYLFISHDHWDHLDYETLLGLVPKVSRIITGLGVAVHLQRWGFHKNIIEEKDWDQEIILGEGFKVNTTSGRHFSGRGFKRNQSLWLSFVLTTPTMKIFLGGDSGYDTHFRAIGNTFGPFDLAVLECGQYNEYWKYIHMMPEEVVQASMDLKAIKLFPVHWAKFSLALHSWDDPAKRIVAEAKKKNVALITPMIGEEVDLISEYTSKEWWIGIE